VKQKAAEEKKRQQQLLKEAAVNFLSLTLLWRETRKKVDTHTHLFNEL
jgi:hypothetical protein